MSHVGGLRLGVAWNGQTVVNAHTASTRPMAARMFIGMQPGQVERIVPLLFSVCGRAQGAAASVALQAAQNQDTVPSEDMRRQIVCEVLQEHLWRLMLDWPKVLGLDRQDARFARWHALLRKVAAGESGMDSFRQEFERHELGMPIAEWRGIRRFADLQAWWNVAETPLARILNCLHELDAPRSAEHTVRLLPAWSAAEAQAACAGKWDVRFSANPDWHGEAAETGAWSYFAQDALVCDVRLGGASPVLVRLLARVLDVIEMAGVGAARRLDVNCTLPDEAVAIVRTARGILMHHVRMEKGLVAQYEIVAPTEWNFHAEGAYVRGMQGRVVADRERLMQLAQVEALSLDPCVAYEIEVSHA